MKRLFTLLAFIILSTTCLRNALFHLKRWAMMMTSLFWYERSNLLLFQNYPEYEINGSKLVIYFEPSQALIREKSYINLFIGPKPVYSGRLQKILSKDSVNLTRADVSADNYLKIAG
jgi:hypothetical protein